MVWRYMLMSQLHFNLKLMFYFLINPPAPLPPTSFNQCLRLSDVSDVSCNANIRHCIQF